jgi:competence protein ComEC
MINLHFLNVGKGSCTILELQSGISIVDIDDSRVAGDSSLTDPFDYLHRLAPGRIFRFVLTHPDMDHMSGLAKLAATHEILNFWDTANDKVLAASDWAGSPYDERDWSTYQSFRASRSSPKCVRPLTGATAECCWVQDGISVLAPSQRLVMLGNESREYNHLSYVLRVQHAGVRTVLGGDATVDAWDDILARCGSAALRAEVFLAPHHGSPDNINDRVFRHIRPDYVVVSVAAGVDYDYDYYNKLATHRVLSTKYYGTMRLEIRDHGDYTLFLERNAP